MTPDQHTRRHVLKILMRTAAIAALALAPMAVPSSASNTPNVVRAEIDRPSGYVHGATVAPGDGTASCTVP
ncbi:hypothetical protein ACIQNT_32210 [Streptomyces luteogriseus]|uniref:hypothetical protein n=1 Tax=Streptomyces luteogriseus TaxID=68233 RepID=UPI003803A6EE